MGVKISNLPAVVTPSLSDIFPIVQSGVTYKESFTQLTNLFATAGANANITSLSGLTTPLSVAQGGTGSATGNPTFASVTFSPSTQGIVGTTTNNNASSGYVGQLISSVINNAGAISISSNTATNLTSISLTAGDWDVYGNITFVPTGSLSVAASWISATSATLPDSSLYNINAVTGLQTNGIAAPYFRASLASTTTIYLSGYTTIDAGTCTIRGGVYARRTR